VRLSVRLSASLVVAVAIVSLAFALYQTQSERFGLRRDLERQALDLAESLEKSVAPLVGLGTSGSRRELQKLVGRFHDHDRLAGIAIYDPQNAILAISTSLAPRLAAAPASVTKALQEGDNASEFFDSMHVVALPVRDEASAITGALAVFHDASYIQAETLAVWRRSLASVVIQTVLIVGVTLFVLRWGLLVPLAGLTAWLRDIRTGSGLKAVELPKEVVFPPFHREAIRLATTLNEARAAAEEEARLRDAAESQWTPERLRIFVQTRLNGSRLFALSNREPYEHVRRGNAIEVSVPASGLVTALEPVLRACEGTWIAQGSGDADREYVDENDRLRVPPDHPQYTLRRVWLTPEEEEGFYFGFANEGLWPLCHIAHTKPLFRDQDWQEYEKVNRRFADALLEEARDEEQPLVLVQDYHFALVPAMIKEVRPDARTAIFWHIPWPNPEAFGICPWQRQLLQGLLGADLIGFHLQSHCNNFLDTVDRTLESRVDRERFAVDRRGHHTSVRPFPISVPFPCEPADTAPIESSYEERAKLLRRLGIHASMMGIGVDRVDYTKGLPERFLALEEFFDRYPVYRGQFTFVQVGAPSRTRIPRYQELMSQVSAEVDRINRRFQSGDWKPIVLLAQHHSHDEIEPYYRAADVCLVTSLHDGMNLVAKEFVAAQNSEQGVLILSRFAGASHELADALHVNPYDIGETANTIHRALGLSPEDRRARLARMRQFIREHNIYRWAGNLIAELAAVRLPLSETAPQESRSEPAKLAAFR
jgi:trehalose-6-phosphate synthase